MTIKLENIQGNIFGGFNKDFQDFLFLKVKDKVRARKWIKENSKELISTSKKVLAFNNAFKSLVASGIAKPESIISARWANSSESAVGRPKQRQGTPARAFADEDDHGQRIGLRINPEGRWG